MTVILVCGGRDYADHAKVHEVLHLHVPAGATVRHGAYRGADRLADEWAKANEFATDPCPADWSRGGRAGPERNQRMLDKGGVVLCIAFPGDRGTADMKRRCRAAGVPVLEAD